jgi:lysophospholipase
MYFKVKCSFLFLFYYIIATTISPLHAKNSATDIILGQYVMSNKNLFTQEPLLKKRLLNEITYFWQQGVFSSFLGVDSTRINFAYFNQSNAQECIVIVNGRNESYVKYKELSYDLSQQGYHVFLFDHRGQGLSERLLSSSHKGYVNKFQDYVSDLSSFITNIVKPNCANKPYLLGHSMGSAISARYLQDNPNVIQAAALSSPMFGFSAAGIPKFIAKSLIKGLHAINQLTDNTPWYFLGHQGYQKSHFTNNVLSQSELRFKIFNALFEKVPEIQLGGVTLNWLVEGIKAQDEIFAQLEALSTPIIVLQAGKDTVIDNVAQDDFCERLHQLHPQSCPNGKAIKVNGALHELFFEKDEYRNQALTEVITWFNKQNKFTTK